MSERVSQKGYLPKEGVVSPPCGGDMRSLKKKMSSMWRFDVLLEAPLPGALSPQVNPVCFPRRQRSLQVATRYETKHNTNTMQHVPMLLFVLCYLALVLLLWTYFSLHLLPSSFSHSLVPRCLADDRPTSVMNGHTAVTGAREWSSSAVLHVRRENTDWATHVTFFIHPISVCTHTRKKAQTYRHTHTDILLPARRHEAQRKLFASVLEDGVRKEKRHHSFVFLSPLCNFV